VSQKVDNLVDFYVRSSGFLPPSRSTDVNGWTQITVAGSFTAAGVMARRCWSSSRIMALLPLRLMLISGFMRHVIMRAFLLISFTIGFEFAHPAHSASPAPLGLLAAFWPDFRQADRARQA